MNKILIKLIGVLAIAIIPSIMAKAQQNKKIYKVVMQVSGNDTLVHKSVIRNINNVLKAFDEVKIEVVAHGPGIEFLLNSSAFVKYITELHNKGVVFLACQNTLDDKKISLSALNPIAVIVPSGIAHLIRRQDEGWSYVKAGF